MFRSLHRKLVLILVLLIVSVMAVVGTFLINSINTFYLNSFYEQMQAVFTTDTIRSMQEAAAEPGAGTPSPLPMLQRPPLSGPGATPAQ